MSTAQKESLAGSGPPSAKLILKWLAIVLGLAFVTLIVVGLLLPRQWHVEHSVEIEAELDTIHALVSDVERWNAWMFDPAAGPQMQVEAAGSGVGATITWTGGGSRGSMTLVEADPQVGIAWEGKIETDEVNNHGSIAYERVEGRRVRVTLIDEGTLPPVLGGYFVPVMNSALSQHFEAALARLEAAAEAD